MHRLFMGWEVALEHFVEDGWVFDVLVCFVFAFLDVRYLPLKVLQDRCVRGRMTPKVNDGFRSQTHTLDHYKFV